MINRIEAKSQTSWIATLSGWIHQANVTLLFCFSVIVFAIKLFITLIPLHPHFALTFITILVVALLGLLVIAGIHIHRIDSTESLSVQLNGAITMLSAKNPSVNFMLQIFQQVFKPPQPVASIPAEIDPKSDPSLFKMLSPEEKEKITFQEIQTVFKRISEPESAPKPSSSLTEPEPQSTASVDTTKG